MSRPLLKFCGNRSYDDYKLAVKSEADYIGFIFYRGSQRYVDPVSVKGWIKTTPPKAGQNIVAVFVNPTLDEVMTAAGFAHVIQLHGNESPRFLQTVKSHTKKKVWKALHYGDELIQEMKAYEGHTDGYIIDSKNKDAWGGTGRSFNWSSTHDYLKESHRQNAPCFIAGGVHAGNIEKLMDYNPDGIDLASGIEVDNQKSELLMAEIERKVGGHYVKHAR